MILAYAVILGLLFSIQGVFILVILLFFLQLFLILLFFNLIVITSYIKLHYLSFSLFDKNFYILFFTYYTIFLSIILLFLAFIQF